MLCLDLSAPTPPTENLLPPREDGASRHGRPAVVAGQTRRVERPSVALPTEKLQNLDPQKPGAFSPARPR